MIVKCITNNLKNLNCPDTLLKEIEFSLGSYDCFNLSVNDSYVVKGISYRNGYPWYYICENMQSTYPMLFSAELFEIIDSRLSKCWVFGKNLIKLKDGTFQYYSRITFNEWANDDYFYDKLIDGNIENLEIFKRYNEFIELEYPDITKKEKAILIDDKWIQCTKCENIWEEISTLGQIICKQCLHKQNNPLFKYDF